MDVCAGSRPAECPDPSKVRRVFTCGSEVEGSVWDRKNPSRGAGSSAQRMGSGRRLVIHRVITM